MPADPQENHPAATDLERPSGMVKPKRPALWLSGLLLLVLPGLNLLYAGIWRRGWVVVSLSLAAFVLQLVASLLWAPQSYLALTLGIGGLLTLYVVSFFWALIDNVVSRLRWHRQGFPRSPRRIGPKLSIGLAALALVAKGMAVSSILLFDDARTVHPFSIPSGSMEPSLRVGDMFVGVRPTTRPLSRGEVVVFKPGARANAPFYVKRLIGLPGDRIAIDNHRAIINGEPEAWHSRDASDPGAIRACLDQRCYDLLIDNPGRVGTGASMDERQLGPDEYFVMGDHRDQSLDSRFATIGGLPSTRIFYRGYLIYWPFDRWRRLL